MTIQHNLLAMNATGVMGINTKNKQKSMERLSSGYRINRAADDAAGLSISEKMRSQVRGLTRASQNAQDGISLCQTADGALSEVTSMLHRMTELSVQASNTAVNNLEDREAIQKEINELLNEIDRVSDTAEFNKKRIFSNEAVDAEAIGEAGGTVSKYGIAFDKAKRSLLNGTYRQTTIDTLPTCLQEGYYSSNYGGLSDNVNKAIKFMSNAAIMSDLYESYNQIQEMSVDSSEKKTLFQEKANNYIPLLVDNAKCDMISGLSDVAQSQYEAGNECLLQKNYYNAYLYYNNASYVWNNSAPVNEARALTHLSTILSDAYTYGRQEYLNKELEHMIDGAVMASWSGCNTVSVCRDITYYDDYRVEDVTARFFLGFDYNSLTGACTCLKNGNEVSVSDQIVFAYMSLFDDLYEKIPGVSENGEEEQDDRGWWLQVGANSGQGIDLNFGYMDTQIIGVRGMDVTTLSGAQAGITRSQDAMNYVTKMRSKIGAYQNRIEYAVKIDNNTAENLQAAESRIRDEDMAEGITQLSKDNILEQAAQAMLSQANQTNQGVISLLQ